MSYIAVDLDALGMMPAVGAASGLGAERALYGLVKLWEWCWRQEDDLVTAVHLHGFFGVQDPAIVQALEAFGFIAEEEGKFRVRGAERYLRVRRAQREAGKRTVELKKKASKVSSPAGLPAAHLEVESSPTASSEQRAASSESTTKKPLSTSSTGGPPAGAEPSQLQLVPPEAPRPKAPSDVETVFEFWRATSGHAKAKLDSKRERAVRDRLKDGYSVDDLKQAIVGCSKTPHNQGQNDRGERYDLLELICRDAAHVDRFMRNAEKPPVPKANACPNDISQEAHEFHAKYAGCRIDFDTELPITDPQGNPLPYPGAPFELAIKKASAS